MSIKQSPKRTKVNDKIQGIIDWYKKYPSLRLMSTPNISDAQMDRLIELAKRESINLEDLIEEYKGKVNDFLYLRSRCSKGKLTQEQLEKCREGDFRGVFGYSTKATDLARTYRININKITYILDNYGTVENFILQYVNNNLQDEDIRILKDNLRHSFDLSGTEDKEIDLFFHAAVILREGFGIYDSKALLNEVEILRPREKDILTRKYGLRGEKTESLENIRTELDFGRERVRQIQAEALAKLRAHGKQEKYSYSYFFKRNEKLITPEELQRIEELKNTIFSSNIVFYPDDEYRDEPINLDFNAINAEYAQIIANIKVRIKSHYIEYLRIEEMGLSTRAYNALRRNGITTFKQLIENGVEKLLSFGSLGEKSLYEIDAKIREIQAKYPGIELSEAQNSDSNESDELDLAPSQEELHNIEYLRIEDMGLPGRVVKVLEANGITTYKQLIGIGAEELLGFKNLGVRSLKEINAKIKEIQAQQSGIEPSETQKSDSTEPDKLDLEQSQEELHNIGDLKIEEMGLSVRAFNALRRNRITTLRQLIGISDKELLGFKNLGERSLKEIKEKIRKILEEKFGIEFDSSNPEGTHKMAEVRGIVSSLRKGTVAETIGTIVGEMSRGDGTTEKSRE